MSLKSTKSVSLHFPFRFFTANLSHSLMMQAVVFSSNGSYHNLSRIDPATISTGVGSSTYFHAVGGGSPYMFTSLVLVNSCHLDEPRTSSAGKTQKLIEGACIEGEWERLVGCIGQIIHAREFKGQIQAGNLSFTTAFASAGNRAFIILFFILHLNCFCSSSIFPFYLHHWPSCRDRQFLFAWSQWLWRFRCSGLL